MQKVDSGDRKLSEEEKVLENLKTECNDTNAKIQSLHAETESMRALVWNLIYTQIFLFISHLFIQRLSQNFCLWSLPTGPFQIFFMYNIDLCSYIQKRGLENSLNDTKHWHDIELQNLGSVIGKLEAELADVRGDIEQQQRDYETLLNNKKRLEMEIGMYHGILDGEENRFHPSM